MNTYLFEHHLVQITNANTGGEKVNMLLALYYANLPKTCDKLVVAVTHDQIHASDQSTRMYRSPVHIQKCATQLKLVNQSFDR